MRGTGFAFWAAVPLLAVLAVPAVPSASADMDRDRILRAIETLKRELLSAQKADGSWEDPAWGAAPAAGIGGHTALVTWALLQAGVDPHSEPIRKAVQNLLQLDMMGTYNRSLRCMVLASLARMDPLGKYARAMQADVDFLLRSRLPNGRWTYVPTSTSARRFRSPDRSRLGDNSNTQFAVLALREAALAGAKIPRQIWSDIREYWQRVQGSDGGFSYRDGSGGNSYGSMTAAGLASLFIAEEMGRAGQCCTGQLPEPIAKALDWLSENFAADVNPRHRAFWLYWLYSLERVAETSGYRYFGEHDWFAEGAEAIIRALESRTIEDHAAARLSGPAFALIFLAKGIAPVVCNKLQFGDQWNPNPLDATYMARYLATAVFERHLNWQIVSLEAPLETWHEAPVLLLTVKQLPPPDDPVRVSLRQRIRQFCETGGTVLIDGTCKPSGRFLRSIEAFLRDIWPERKFRHLPKEHPLYRAHFPLAANKVPLWAVGNGCRECVIVSKSDLSCTWHKNLTKAKPEAFQVAANLYMYATDKSFRSKLQPRSTLPRSLGPAERKLTVAHVRHPGNWNACPQALPLLSAALTARAGVGLNLADVELTDADLLTARVLVISGQGKVDFSDAQIGAIRRFIKAGGFVLGEALLGDREFARSLRRLAAAALFVAPRPIPRGDPLIKGTFDRAAFDLTNVRYSRRLRWRRGISGPAMLEGCKVEGRWAFLISPYDLSNGLTTATPFESLGYAPDDATRIAANCMLYFLKTPGQSAPLLISP